jgi:hypothetical protein
MRPTPWSLSLAGAAALAFVACSSAPSHPGYAPDCISDAGGCAPPTSSGSGSGGFGEGGEEGGACSADPAASQCDQCADTDCCADLETCGNDMTCEMLLECAADCTTSTCVDDCEGQYPSAKSTYQALLACVDGKCPVCTESGVGDPCSSTDNICVAGTSCQGKWCTKPCSKTSDCTGIGPGGEDIQDEPNACVRGSCYPGCTSDTQCAVYAGTFCQVVTDVGNTQVQICSAGPDAGMP